MAHGRITGTRSEAGRARRYTVELTDLAGVAAATVSIAVT
jgi:hypothetical protein